MNLQIGKVENYNNKILILSPSFKIGANLKINLDDEKDKPDVKSNRKQKQYIEPNTGSTNKILNLMSSPIKNTNKMSNLTSSSNMMLR